MSLRVLLTVVLTGWSATYPLTGVVAATCTNSGAAGTSGVTDHLPDANDTQGW